ncbi:MAG TPA: tetratricopeptide repeat protein, partial [Bdellovibrionales bacterium]|nr:tetratricopeptide repeat protein [Bdellovibrionales bacterium]
VVNAAQEEVDRLVDYQPNDVLEGFFASVKADPTTIAELKEKAKSKEPAVLAKLGKRLVMANRFGEALEPLSLLKPPPPEYWSALLGSARAAYKADSGTKPQLVQALKDAIAAEGGTSRSIGWRAELAGLGEDKAQAAKLRKDGVAVADMLLGDEAKLKEGVKTDLVGEFTGYEPLLVAMARADLIENTGAVAEETAAAWNLAADKAQALKISPGKTGPALRAVIILTKAERYEQANALLGEMLKRDPGDPELLRRRLRALVGLKKFPQAIEVGERVLKNSYGRNEFWVAEVLAKAYIGASQTAKAKALIDTYLSRSDIEWSSLQSSRKTLETLRAQIGQQATTKE